MRKRQPKTVDGFIPRSSSRTLGDAKKARPLRRSDDPKSTRKLGKPSDELRADSARVSRDDIDKALLDIGGDEQGEPKKRGWLRRRKNSPHPKKKLKKRIIITIVVLLLLGAAFIGIKGLLASGNIFQGNLFGLLQNKPLKTDENGQSNVLVFGTSGSVEDRRHAGALLTDTLMVLSINQEKKTAAMVSLPRDLYVDYGGVCPEGYKGRINSMYECYSNGGKDELAGVRALQRKASEVTGLTLHYYTHVNWAVLVSSVNAVGGVPVDVKGDGSCAASGMSKDGVYDVNMKVRYDSGVHVMSGDQALRFSRARGSAGGCGLSRGDYDRQQNQQKVIKALQKKAVSAETLTNIGKVTGLIDAMGENLRTDFDTSEVRTLMSLGKDIPSDKITSISLVGGDKDLLAGSMVNGASVQMPTAGQFEYSEIKSFIRRSLTSDPVVRENAQIAIFNGSGTVGLAQQKSTVLTERGYNIAMVGNAPDGDYGYVTIYDITDKKPATKSKLEKLYGKTAKTSAPPVAVPAGVDIALVYGKTKQR